VTDPAGAATGRRVRDDIEGLRALAVLIVLVDHAFPKVLPGGFVGVDIFFVISGYLIGRHLLQDIEARRFTFLGFYSRRARRIFPALVLVLISVWAVGWFVLSAREFLSLGRQIAAAAAFANNILLWSESGYFDAEALSKPLLHLWSLGIEEQFYILVPALLWLSSSQAHGSIRWVARLGAGSLLAAILLSKLDSTASFYLLHTRFWELAAGVVLAQIELKLRLEEPPSGNASAAPKHALLEIRLFSYLTLLCGIVVLGAAEHHGTVQGVIRDAGVVLTIALAALAALLAGIYQQSAWVRLCTWCAQHRASIGGVSSIAGIVMICASALFVGSANWPGAQTAFPVLGAALLIASTPAAPANRLLALKPAAFIGEMSYPLYLWHWPAIVFFRILDPDPGGVGACIPIAAAFALAWLTKTFIEDPIRFGKMAPARFRLPPLWPVVGALTIAGTVGLMTALDGGLPWRFPPSLRAIADWSDDTPSERWDESSCISKFAGGDDCTPNRRPGIPLLLLWGDSHAGHLSPGLQSIQTHRDFDVIRWTLAACPPTVIPLSTEVAACPERRAEVLRRLKYIKPDTIILGGAWERYMDFGASEPEVLGAIAETIRWLKSNNGASRIVVFGPGPTWHTTLPSDLFRYMAANRLTEIPARLGKVSEATWRLEAAMSAQAASQHVAYVSVLNFFCDQDGCLTVGDRSLDRPDLLYRDKDHLTASGSRRLVEYAAPQLFGEAN
jgi:peptidoglycan/LPS O-acetylase OafA/YrhL